VTATRPAKLYSSALLGLATGLARFPFNPALPLQAEARSRTCGSAITIGLALDQHGCIAGIGMQISACAIGQASAALLAESAAGADAGSITTTTEALEHWLAGEGPLPPWPGLAVLVPAREHTGRHGALLLPWKAACMALSSGATSG
jgi:NifU-like protein involved in Fe-S cluster formation